MGHGRTRTARPGVITVFGRAMITDNFATVYGDGSAARDYVYVDDVVDAFMRAAEAPHSMVGTYNIGTGQQTTVIEVHRLIAEVLGSSFVAVLRGGAQRRVAGDRTGRDRKRNGNSAGRLPSTCSTESNARLSGCAAPWRRSRVSS